MVAPTGLQLMSVESDQSASSWICNSQSILIVDTKFSLIAKLQIDNDLITEDEVVHDL